MKKKVWIYIILILLLLSVYIGSNLGRWLYLKAPFVGLSTPIEISGLAYVLDADNDLQCIGETSYAVFGYIDGRDVNGAEGIFRGAIDVSGYSIPLSAIPYKYDDRESGVAVSDQNGYLCVYYDPRTGDVPYEYELILNPDQQESVIIRITSTEGCFVAVNANEPEEGRQLYLDYVEAQNQK